jgi:hypothetical protein
MTATSNENIYIELIVEAPNTENMPQAAREYELFKWFFACFHELTHQLHERNPNASNETIWRTAFNTTVEAANQYDPQLLVIAENNADLTGQVATQVYDECGCDWEDWKPQN